MTPRSRRSPRRRVPPPSRSTTSAAPSRTASKWRGCSPGGPRASRWSARKALRRTTGEAMGKVHVTSTVNGDPVEFLCEPEQTLLDVLRDVLYLTGSKEGCASGDCGACSVTLDGRQIG